MGNYSSDSGNYSIKLDLKLFKCCHISNQTSGLLFLILRTALLLRRTIKLLLTTKAGNKVSEERRVASKRAILGTSNTMYLNHDVLYKSIDYNL